MDSDESSEGGVFMGVVILASGGIDSFVMSKIIKEQDQKLIPIFIDYGQLSAKKEWEACKKIFKNQNFPEPKKIDLSGYGKFFLSGITDETKRIYEDAFLPGRNMLFLLVGAAYAHTIGEKSIAIGLLSEESHLFPDQTEDFVINANFALNSALGGSFTILTPLIKFGKKDIIKLAKDYGLNLADTYSCHLGKDRYCGKCVACKEIMKSGEAENLPQFKGDK